MNWGLGQIFEPSLKQASDELYMEFISTNNLQEATSVSQVARLSYFRRCTNADRSCIACTIILVSYLESNYFQDIS